MLRGLCGDREFLLARRDSSRHPNIGMSFLGSIRLAFVMAQFQRQDLTANLSGLKSIPSMEPAPCVPERFFGRISGRRKKVKWKVELKQKPR